MKIKTLFKVLITLSILLIPSVNGGGTDQSDLSVPNGTYYSGKLDGLPTATISGEVGSPDSIIWTIALVANITSCDNNLLQEHATIPVAYAGALEPVSWAEDDTDFVEKVALKDVGLGDVIVAGVNTIFDPQKLVHETDVGRRFFCVAISAGLTLRSGDFTQSTPQNIFDLFRLWLDFPIDLDIVENVINQSTDLSSPVPYIIGIGIIGIIVIIYFIKYKK